MISNTNAFKVERPSELQLTKKETESVDATTSIQTQFISVKNGFDALQSNATPIPTLSLDRQRKQQRWWRKRSVGNNGKCRTTSVMSNENVIPSPALTPISNRSTELTSSIITSNNTGGTRSKSSSRSGSSRSVIRIFKSMFFLSKTFFFDKFFYVKDEIS